MLRLKCRTAIKVKFLSFMWICPGVMLNSLPFSLISISFLTKHTTWMMNQWKHFPLFFFCDLHLNHILLKILMYMLHRKSLLLTWLIIITHISIVLFFFKTVNQLIKYMYKLTSLINNAWRTTSVKPLSCKEERRDGSWKTYTVTTSVAENKKILKTIFTSDKNECSVYVSMFFSFQIIIINLDVFSSIQQGLLKPIQHNFTI